MSTLQAPRGTRDILPDDQPYWQYIYDCVTKQARVFSFQKIDFPIFEAVDL
ncbi:histidine--tRNA ligase, partial [Candidatus Berkelbacteria bacterium]|nr:histidine--tRNA ligase [Candidatus Berkelbacteria bacterium]